MNSTQNIHGIRSLKLGSIDFRDGPVTGPHYVRSLDIEGTDGSCIRIELFADSEASLTLQGEEGIPDEGSVDLRAEAAPQPRFKAGQRVRCVEANESDLTAGHEYTVSGADSDWIAVEGNEGRFWPKRFVAVESRPFQVGDKVTPTTLWPHCNVLKAGGIYTVDAVGVWYADSRPQDQSICLQGMVRMWPASQFRLADPDPLADEPRPLEDSIRFGRSQ